MSIFLQKWGNGRYTMSVVTPTFIIEPKDIEIRYCIKLVIHI